MTVNFTSCDWWQKAYECANNSLMKHYLPTDDYNSLAQADAVGTINDFLRLEDAFGLI